MGVVLGYYIVVIFLHSNRTLMEPRTNHFVSSVICISLLSQWLIPLSMLWSCPLLHPHPQTAYSIECSDCYSSSVVHPLQHINRVKALLLKATTTTTINRKTLIWPYPPLIFSSLCYLLIWKNTRLDVKLDVSTSLPLTYHWSIIGGLSTKHTINIVLSKVTSDLSFAKLSRYLISLCVLPWYSSGFLKATLLSLSLISLSSPLILLSLLYRGALPLPTPYININSSNF